MRDLFSDISLSDTLMLSVLLAIFAVAYRAAWLAERGYFGA